MRIGAAILVDTLAFVVWNLSARAPAQMVRDIAGGVRRPGILVRGIISFLVGLLLLIGSLTLLLPLLLPQHALVVLGTWAALTGLLVAQLVGPDIYGRRSPGSKP